MTKRVVVVGAGIGGLTAAAELAKAGLDVLVVERAERPGGKLRELYVAGHAIDSGPTVMTMRWVFDKLFDDLGTSTATHLGLMPAERLARHWWDAGSRLDLYANPEASAEAIRAFAGANDAQGFMRFCDDAARIYNSLEDTFIRASKPGVLELCHRFGWRGWRKLLALHPYTNLWQLLGNYFQDARLRQLFARYAGYCGSSPFLAPATLMLVAHAERAGLWLVEGGMYRIVEALCGLVEQHGGQIRTSSHVQRILCRGSAVTGIALANGEHIDADIVIWNGDAAALAAGLAGDDLRQAAAPVYPEDRSMSGLTWSLVGEVTGQPLIRHNVFFSSDYRREFDEIFAALKTPAAPTVYVCAHDRGDADKESPAGNERLLVIVNAPPNGDAREFTTTEAEQCTKRTFDHLAQCGVSVSYRATNVQLTAPTDFARLYPGTGGALYGRASHGWMSSFRRADNRTKIGGLYLAGGSTHPGPGVPMAALSGRLTAANVRADLASIKP